jgi:hypothetical protein
MYRTTVRSLIKLNATVTFRLPAGTTVIWLYCFCGAILDSYLENLVALGGELCSSSREAGSDSCVQLHQWTHCVILPVAFYRCETWSLAQIEHRLTVFQNRFVRRMFGFKREDVTGVLRKLHHGKLHNLCSSQDNCRVILSEMIRCADNVLCWGIHTIFCRKAWREELGRKRRRLENNMKVDLKETVCEDVNRIHMAQDRVQWRAGWCVHGDEPSG